MAHIHGVFDSDAHLVIDPITRKITNGTPEKTAIMQHDHNSERFTFEIPKEVEGHDMSLCNVVQVHYLNTDASNKSVKKGVYEVQDLQISPEDESVLIGSWLLSNNVTQFVGKLDFILRFSCVVDGVVEYAWHTDICSDFSISKGINNGEAIAADYADILEQWRKELEELAGSGGGGGGGSGEPGFSPTVDIEEIEGGHRVTVTDANGDQSFDVMNGQDYTLTEADKTEIAEETKGLLDETLSQKADLDENGKLLESQLPDNTGSSGVEWEDVKNRPFYSVEAPANITWGGDTTGKVSTGYRTGDPLSGYTDVKYYKVSDDMSMNHETFRSCTRYSRSFAASDLQIRTHGGIIAYTWAGLPFVLFVPEGGGKVFEGYDSEFTVPEGGIYAMWIQLSNGNYIDNLVFEGLKQLDNQFVAKAETIEEGETLPPTSQAVIDYVSGVVESFDTALSAAIGTGVLE